MEWALEAITFDFGNTLVPVDRAGLAAVVDQTTRAMAERLGPFDPRTVGAIWAEERERQFREEVPRFREVDLAQRVVRVLARLRGLAAPPPDVPWDDATAASRSTPDEVGWTVDRYSRTFVDSLAQSPGTTDRLARLSAGYRLAIISNWPLAATIDRYAEAAGWLPYLAAIVVSQRVGVIKPHPAIFGAARTALGEPAPGRILHVGDDWTADVVGAKRAGWRAAYVRARPEDSPLPGSVPDGSVVADLEIATLAELEVALGG